MIEAGRRGLNGGKAWRGGAERNGTQRSGIVYSQVSDGNNSALREE